MNKYELTVILGAKTTPAKKKSFAEKLAKTISLNGGKIVAEKEWGLLEFAYKIKKSDSGVYLFYELELEPSGVGTLTDKLKNDEEVIRHLLIRKDK